MARAVQTDHIADDGAGTLAAGTQLDGGAFTIQQFLMRGAFGIVYRATDPLGRQVAIKECFPSTIAQRQGNVVTSITPAASGAMRKMALRFLAEAQLHAKVSHSNVPTPHHLFAENNTQYLVMPWVNGPDALCVMIDDPARFTPPTLRAGLIDCLNALDAIHAAGIVHRDITLDNVMIDHNGAFQIVDFGNACEMSDQTPPSIGTPTVYAAPTASHSLDQRDDLYALAASFYHLITGHCPQRASARLAAKTDPYKSLATTRRDFDVTFLTALDDAMSLEADLRPQTAKAWRALITGYKVPKPQAMTTEIAPDTDLSSFVAEVNKSVALPLQKAKRQCRRPREKQRLVDVFGDPIDDIDVWTAQQGNVRPVQQSMQPPSNLFRSLTQRVLSFRKSHHDLSAIKSEWNRP